jgi:hypothetical protein
MMAGMRASGPFSGYPVALVTEFLVDARARGVICGYRAVANVQKKFTPGFILG